MVKNNAEADASITIVGNKQDLCTNDPSQRMVTREAAEKFALENGCLYAEVSALSGTNVNEAI